MPSDVPQMAAKENISTPGRIGGVAYAEKMRYFRAKRKQP